LEGWRKPRLGGVAADEHAVARFWGHEILGTIDRVAAVTPNGNE
jgi:hypothetical protein